MDVITMSTEQVLDAMKKMNLGDKRIARAERSNNTIPTKGIFAQLDKEVAKMPKGDINYPVIRITDAKGKNIGFISFATIFQQKSAGKARKVGAANTNGYAGKYFHAGAPVSQLDGTSEAEQIANLMGKKFTAKLLSDVVIPALNFTEDNKVIMYNTEEEALLAVSTKDCYQFTVID